MLRRSVGIVLVACGLVLAACSSGDDSTAADSDTTAEVAEGAVSSEATVDESDASDGEDVGESESGAEPESQSDTEAAAPVLAADAPLLPAGQVVAADLAGPSAELITLQEDPYIGAAVYPRPDYAGNPWSQWGQGVTLADGRVITAIGDHLGPDGNSYLFVYDPEAGTLTRFADVLSALDHEPGSWGYGKVHGQMVHGGDGGIYFTTYWGTRRGLSFDGSYEGDVLFRLDAESLDLQPIVVPAPGFGVPSLAGDGRGKIYGEAVDPTADSRNPGGGFFVYDVASGAVSTFAEDPAHAGFRNVLVGPDGAAFYAADGGGLFSYDPGSESISSTDIRLADQLRASTFATSDGTVFGVTDRPSFELFALDPDGEVSTLGVAEMYTASMALLPDESGFLYVPGAHGQAPLFGTPLVVVDRETGDQTTLVELNDLVKDELGLDLGGTYSVTVDEARGVAHIGFNAGPIGDPWGEVVFVVVELP